MRNTSGKKMMELLPDIQAKKLPISGKTAPQLHCGGEYP
jgi:hypothetical protein